MLSIPVYNAQGEPAGDVQIDPELLGGKVRPSLLKQAVVGYLANRRQNTSATKSRGLVAGSTRKLYRQKGTGNARVGNRRTVVRRGGGVAFAKGRQDYHQSLNKKMRRIARNNAILSKIESQAVAVIDGLSFDEPSTKRISVLLKAVGAERGCVIALDDFNDTLYRSARNIPKTEIGPLREVNAYDVLRRKKLVMSRQAFDMLVQDPVLLRGSSNGSQE